MKIINVKLMRVQREGENIIISVSDFDRPALDQITAFYLNKESAELLTTHLTNALKTFEK